MGRDLEPGETIDFDAVLPARCRIVIKKSDDGYDRVDDVLRAERRPQTPSRQPAAVPVADSPEMDTLMQRIDATSEPDDDIPF
jgi:hypothetical protein